MIEACNEKVFRILSISDVFVGFKKGTLREEMSLFNYVSSLPFSLSLFNNMGFRRGWQCEEQPFFDQFQGCDLLGDQPSVKYITEIRPLCQFNISEFQLKFSSILVKSATSFHFHLIYKMYFKHSYNNILTFI